MEVYVFNKTDIPGFEKLLGINAVSEARIEK